VTVPRPLLVAPVAAATLGVVLIGIVTGELGTDEIEMLAVGAALTAGLATFALLALWSRAGTLGPRPRGLVVAGALTIASVVASVAGGRFMPFAVGVFVAMGAPLSFILAGASLRPSGRALRGSLLGLATYVMTGLPVAAATWTMLDGDLGDLMTGEGLLFVVYEMAFWPGMMWGFANGWVGA